MYVTEHFRRIVRSFMDRRQRKTRELIFNAFTELLSEKEYEKITVGEIIQKADVGRATFYAHFETKDYLLKELCAELFCHIFDAENNTQHRHIFVCDAPDSVFLHLFMHLRRNDNNILRLFTSPCNDLFLRYFKENLKILAKTSLPLFEDKKPEKLPDDFWINHICSVFTETAKWWTDNGMKESPETITEYFLLAI